MALRQKPNNAQLQSLSLAKTVGGSGVGKNPSITPARWRETVRCALAAKSLQDLDFSNVTAVDMRIEDWAKAGYPLVRE